VHSPLSPLSGMRRALCSVVGGQSQRSFLLTLEWQEPEASAEEDTEREE